MVNTQPKPPYSLRQVVAIIPCSPRTLRRRIAEAPATAPPCRKRATNNPDYWHWEFPQEEFEVWLAKREKLRTLTGKSWLRFYDVEWLPKAVGAAA